MDYTDTHTHTQTEAVCMCEEYEVASEAPECIMYSIFCAEETLSACVCTTEIENDFSKNVQRAPTDVLVYLYVCEWVHV